MTISIGETFLSEDQPGLSRFQSAAPHLSAWVRVWWRARGGVAFSCELMPRTTVWSGGCNPAQQQKSARRAASCRQATGLRPVNPAAVPPSLTGLIRTGRTARRQDGRTKSGAKERRDSERFSCAPVFFFFARGCSGRRTLVVVGIFSRLCLTRWTQGPHVVWMLANWSHGCLPKEEQQPLSTREPP